MSINLSLITILTRMINDLSSKVGFCGVYKTFEKSSFLRTYRISTNYSTKSNYFPKQESTNTVTNSQNYTHITHYTVVQKKKKNAAQ